MSDSEYSISSLKPFVHNVATLHKTNLNAYKCLHAQLQYSIESWMLAGRSQEVSD